MEIAKLADLSCDAALALLWDYLDAELDARTTERVAIHLWLCFGCHHLFEVERRLLDAIAATAPPVDLTTLQPRILRVLADEPLG